MKIPQSDKNLLILSIINITILFLHMYMNCTTIYYFFQLTIIGQFLIIVNFIFSIVFHEKKSNNRVKKNLSRLHLITVSLQAIVVLAFWGLRIFFRKGIIPNDEQYSIVIQILSISIHGGSFLTLLYFVKNDQIIIEKNIRTKFIIHLLWCLPYIFLQYFKWLLTGEHMYGFLQHFTWVQLIIFQTFFYFTAVLIDYTISIRHGLKLTMKVIQNDNKKSLQEIEKQKGIQDSKQYINQEKLRKIMLKKKN